MKIVSILLIAAVLSVSTLAQVTRTSKPIFLGNRTSNPRCTRAGSLYYNITSKTYRVCTAAGAPGTWSDLVPSSTSAVNAYPFTDFGSRVMARGTLGSSGVNDIYTVPAGYSLLTISTLTYGVMSGYSASWGVKDGASYRRLSQTSAVAANASRTDSYAFVFGPGEVVQLSSTVSALKWQFEGVLIPVTQLTLVRAMVVSQTAATNTMLYTVPAGKRAVVINSYSPSGANGNIAITNDSGAAGTLLAALVPSGETVGTQWYVQQSIAHSNGGIGQSSFLPRILEAGDAIWYQTSINNSGQVVWGAFIEVPNT